MTNVTYLRPSPASPAPLSVEAEQQLLGMILLSPGLIGKAVRGGGVALFGDPVHARLFEVMASHEREGRLVSPVTMADAMRGEPGIAELGGVGYIARLAGASISPSSAPALIGHLRDMRRKRDLHGAIAEAQAAIASGGDSADMIAGRLEAALLASEPVAQEGGPVSMLRAVSVAMEMARAAYVGDSEETVQTGIGALDRLIGGLYPGEMTLIGGRPSMGKTALALSIALNVARSGKGVCIASLEMNPEALALRALSEETSRRKNAISYASIRRGEMSEAEIKCLGGSAKAVSELPITFLPRQFSDIGALVAGAKQVKRAMGDDMALMIVDYAQLLRAPGKGRYEQITDISMALKALSGQINVPLIALSQLSRAVESRDDKRPMLSDLRESGQLEQDADAVLFCYRDEYYVERDRPAEAAPLEEREEWRRAMDACRHRLEIIVAKQRQGAIGTAHVRCNPALNRIWED